MTVSDEGPFVWHTPCDQAARLAAELGALLGCPVQVFDDDAPDDALECVWLYMNDRMVASVGWEPRSPLRSQEWIVGMATQMSTAIRPDPTRAAMGKADLFRVYGVDPGEAIEKSKKRRRWLSRESRQ